MTGGSIGGPWLVNFGEDATDADYGSAKVRNVVVGVTSYGNNQQRQGSSWFGQNSKFPNSAYGNRGAGNIGKLVYDACDNSAFSGWMLENKRRCRSLISEKCRVCCRAAQRTFRNSRYLNPSIMKFALTFRFALLACTASFSNHLPPISSETYPQYSVVVNNSSWRIERWEWKGSVVALVPQTEVSLNFKDNQVNGFGGCNNFAGSYKLVDDKLSVGTLDATQKGCDPVVKNQESQFLSALESVLGIGSDTFGRLQLFYELEAGEGVLYFTTQN